MIDIKALKDITLNYTVLYVEDDEDIASSIILYLKKLFKEVRYSSNGEDGLKLYTEKIYDIVISDIQMPKMDGLEMAEKIKELNPEQNIIIVSAYSDIDKFTKSIKLGIDGYVLKPISYEEFNSTIYKITEKIKKFKEHKEYSLNLEKLVEEKIAENALLQNEKAENYKQTLFALIDLIESRDYYTGKHSLRVASYSKLIAEELGLSKEECDEIYTAGILHDIGKVAIPDSLLLKPGRLTAKEYEMVKEHSTVGYEILNKIPIFKEVSKIVQSHHERLDGSGYPNSLKGSDVPIKANILAIADSFDAMTTSRIYKKSKSISYALKELKSLSGIQFYKELIKASEKVLKNIKIDQSIDQIPVSNLEEERFSYFYKDNLTGLYNENYLNIILIKNIDTFKCKTIYILSIENFGEFNRIMRWQKGNKLLINVAKSLSEIFNNKHIFRIHANKFVFLDSENYEIKEEDIILIEEEIHRESKDLALSIKKLNIMEHNINSMDKIEELFY